MHMVSSIEPIPQTNPKASYLAHQGEIDAAIHRVLESGWYVLGEEVQAFEQEFAKYIGTKHGIGVANGTDAVELALRACEVGSGDLVITVSHTAVATVAAIELAGATPVLVDIDTETFTIDPDFLEETIKKICSNPSLGKLKAIIPVHLYGHPADMTAVINIAQRYGLYVIEDCSQSHGASFENRKTGTWGHLGAFSLYPTKNLGALGDAGIVVTNDPQLAEKVNILREYGWQQRYVSKVPGKNSRLDPIQAAILRVKLRYLDRDNQQRFHLAIRYREALSGCAVLLPYAHPRAHHVYHQYVVQVDRRDHLRDFLKQNMIFTLVHYPVPVHLQPAYKNRLPLGEGILSRTENVASRIISLPMHPYLTDEEIRRVSNAILDWENQF